MKIGIVDMQSIPGYDACMCIVTPAQASELLKRNTHNRKVKETVVAKYTSELLHNEWRPIPNGIGIDEDGVLIDGQHRLKAIVNSGVSAPLLIVTGFTRVCQEKCDRQSKRTIGDVMVLAGFDVNRPELAAAVFLARFVHQRLNQDASHESKGQPADCDVKDMLKRYEASLQAMSSDNGHGTANKISRRAGCLGALAIWHHNEPIKALNFQELLCAGVAPSKDHPIGALIRGFDGDCWQKAARQHHTGEPDFMRTWYAIQAFREGRSISMIKPYTGKLPWTI